MADYLLPDVGEGLTEAEIVSWRVKEGDVIEINDIVVEIETAKSLVELPSPYAGEVRSLMVAEGDTVQVGTPIIAIGEEARSESPADVFGRVETVDAEAGITIRPFDGAAPFTMVPILEAIEPADPGSYQLSPEDPVVENPDYTVVFSLTAPLRH